VQRAAGEDLLVEGFLVKGPLVDRKLKRFAFNYDSKLPYVKKNDTLIDYDK